MLPWIKTKISGMVFEFFQNLYFYSCQFFFFFFFFFLRYLITYYWKKNGVLEPFIFIKKLFL